MKILLLMLLTIPGFCANIGTLLLQGTVSEDNSIVITPIGTNNISLNLISGESAKQITSVSETCNNALGYKIKLQSLNNGNLLNNAASIAYTISYSGGSYQSIPNTPLQVKNISSLTQKTTNTSEVRINIAAVPNAVSGTYSDTLTLSIEGD